MPAAAAIVRVLQCVALAGFSCVVSRTTLSTVALAMDGVRPGRGASFGNAGGITPGWVAPTATPATLRGLPRMLMDPLSPLVIRPSYLPRLRSALTTIKSRARTAGVAVHFVTSSGAVAP